MRKTELRRIASAVVAVVVAIAMLLLSSCSILKDRRFRKEDVSRKDTSAVKTGYSQVKVEHSTGKEDSRYEKETTITPTIVRDSATNTVKVYPTTIIREKGDVQKEYVYLSTDSTRFDKLEQAMSVLAQTVTEQELHKKSGMPWYVWLCAAYLVIATVFLMIKRKWL